MSSIPGRGTMRPHDVDSVAKKRARLKFHNQMLFMNTEFNVILYLHESFKIIQDVNDWAP